MQESFELGKDKHPVACTPTLQGPHAWGPLTLLGLPTNATLLHISIWIQLWIGLLYE